MLRRSRNTLRTVRGLLVTGIAVILLSAGGAPANLDADPWNILVLTIDNLRPANMSVYGYERNTTPSLAALADEAAVFENAFSNAAWTSPGIVSMFTGYESQVHGQSGRFSYYDAKMTAPLRRLAGHGYGIYGEAIRGPSHEDFGWQKPLGRGTGWRALHDFLDRRTPGDDPFFAWSHLRDVHLPYAPSVTNARRFGATAHTSAAVTAVKQHKLIFRNAEAIDVPWRHAGPVTFTARDRKTVRALYDAEVADLDAKLGRLFDKLKARGLWDRTLIVVTADHGEELFEHGWLGHTSTSYDAKLYDELIRIPLIIRAPDGSLQGRHAALVRNIDLMPTLFELLSLNADALHPPMQGRSLLPLIRGDTQTVRQYVFARTSLKGWTTPRAELDQRVVAARSRNRKLIVNPPALGGRKEGYDLRRDPGEQHNLYPRDPTAFTALETALARWRRNNTAVAATLVGDAAHRRIRQIATTAIARAHPREAVAAWEAIDTMTQTWGLEPEPFFLQARYRTRWQDLQRQAAWALAEVMACVAAGGDPAPQPATDPGLATGALGDCRIAIPPVED